MLHHLIRLSLIAASLPHPTGEAAEMATCPPKGVSISQGVPLRYPVSDSQRHATPTQSCKSRGPERVEKNGHRPTDMEHSPALIQALIQALLTDCGEGRVATTPPPPPGQGRPRPPKTVQSAEGGEGKDKREGSLWLSEAPVRKIILQIHTPARSSQCWSRQTQHGLGGCTWMHLVNGTGNSPSPGQLTLE